MQGIQSHKLMGQCRLRHLGGVVVASVVLLVNFAAIGAPGVSRSFSTHQAPVKKVYAANEDGHGFVAYVVEWKGTDVIVSDPLAKSKFMVGDEIHFMAMKHQSPKPASGFKNLSFMLAGASAVSAPQSTPKLTPDERKRTMRLIKGDLSAAQNEQERFYALTGAVKTSFETVEKDETRMLAKELQALAPRHSNNWNYGNAVQVANQALGRLALAAGDIENAEKYLLASADSKGSPQMNSFGPNMTLASELLAKGRKDAVLKYFEQCRKFWKMGADRLDQWTEDVKAGRSPEFGANMDY